MKKYLIGLSLLVLIVEMGHASAVLAEGPDSGKSQSAAETMGTAFMYQGQLKNNGTPVNGNCEMAFKLYDAETDGNLIGTPATRTVPVANGLFVAEIDFGANAFNGDARWIDLQVRCPAGAVGPFTPLTPRQPLAPAPYALHSANADLLDGYDGLTFQQKPHNVIVVAKSHGDFATITGALASISAPSETNTYLVKVMPGIYSERVTMRDYVDIEGAGELLTRITFNGSPNPDAGTVLGASNAELRFLTVENTGGNANAIAVYNSHASPRLTHVTASAHGATSYNYGIYNDAASPSLTDVDAYVSGTTNTRNQGIYNSSASSPTMASVTITASGGQNSEALVNRDSSPTITSVTASASEATYNAGVSNYNSSPTMMDVSATATGGTESYGLYNGSSSAPTLENVAASASGASLANRGMFNFNASPTLVNVNLSATGGSENSAVRNEFSSATIHDSTLKAFGGANNFGIYNFANSGTYAVIVNNSQLTGSTNTIRNEAPFTVKVGGSLLDGGDVLVNGGTVTCAGLYDEDYAFYADKCP